MSQYYDIRIMFSNFSIFKIDRKDNKHTYSFSTSDRTKYLTNIHPVFPDYNKKYKLLNISFDITLPSLSIIIYHTHYDTLLTDVPIRFKYGMDHKKCISNKKIYIKNRYKIITPGKKYFVSNLKNISQTNHKKYKIINSIHTKILDIKISFF